LDQFDFIHWRELSLEMAMVQIIERRYGTNYRGLSSHVGHLCHTNIPTTVRLKVKQYIFRRKLSKLDFNLHFCIMTSVWDLGNPPFYWMIS